MKRKQITCILKEGRMKTALILAGVLCLSTSVWAAPGASSSHHSQKKTESEAEAETDLETEDDSYAVMAGGWWDDVDEPDLEKDVSYAVFGNDAYRHDQIRSITFTDSLDGANDTQWDVSEDGDETVLCWAEPSGDLYDLYIGADGKILAPIDSDLLFYAFTNAEKIDFQDCFDTEGVVSMFRMFDSCKNLQELDVSGFDTSETEDLALMFSDCQQLKTLNLTGLDTSAAEDFQYMFYNCKSLQELDVSGFDTDMASVMKGMFANCASVRELDVSGFNTAGIPELSYMFYGCESLTALDVSSFDTARTGTMRYMFSFCTNLTSLDLSGFDTTGAEDLTGMFDGCISLTELKMDFQIGEDTLTDDLFYGCDSLPEEMKVIG